MIESYAIVYQAMRRRTLRFAMTLQKTGLTSSKTLGTRLEAGLTKGALRAVPRRSRQLTNERLAGRLPHALAHPVKDLACARAPPRPCHALDLRTDA